MNRRVARWLQNPICDGQTISGSWILAIAVLALYALVLVRTAWVSDDAYFTFRTVDQLAAGNGLVWNAGERVQAYTHPLWLFLLSIAFYLTHEFWLTTIVVSILLASAAAGVYAFGIARGPFAAVAGLALIISSKAFVDYSTSGLENPLSFFLLALFGVVWFRSAPSIRRTGLLSLVGAGIMLCRLDYLLIIGPAVAASTLEGNRPHPRRLRAMLVGLAPLMLWELFSVWYYGFPFPNTAYAKLGSAVPHFQLIEQGSRYLGNSLRLDPITLMIILAGLALTAHPGLRDRVSPLTLGFDSILIRPVQTDHRFTVLQPVLK